MSRTRTLALLRGDVLWQSDKESFTTRHTPTAVNRAINQAIQEFREHVSEAGSPYYLTATSPANMTVGVSSGKAFGVVTMATNLGRVYGVDVTINGQIRSLRSTEFDSRNDYQDSTGPQLGEPECFFLWNETQVGILPAPQSAYSYVLYYLAPLTDLSADSDTFDGQYGWEEYVVYSACVKLHMRDSEPERLAPMIAERDRLLVDIKRRASKRQKQGPQKRQDVRGRHGLVKREWWPWR